MVRDDAGVSADALFLTREASGWRHVLCGRPVHAGTGLELLMADGTWARGVYEWSFREEDLPLLRLDERWGAVEVALGPAAVLRWPDRYFGRVPGQDA
jgi:hypothetical protein